ncbi:MAG: hypothetical protein COW78_11385 [Bdellovibrio sp. CG22_combo_CG10-13_8_21_14_all_39_27]|nr:MAG: hypothetical protein COW78_11385 [Bdellovibrio sp. CG22_combo_CG10-13_8_21_14_all_39_27]
MTFITKINRHLSLILLIAALSGCNQQEFYQKEFLEGVGVPDDHKLKDPAAIPDDPSTGGTVTDPGTGGGTTDPGTGGGTTDPGTGGGTTDPGTGGGTTDPQPGVCGTGTLTDASDTFVQNVAQEAKVDILWVIDNSGSMGDEQDALAYNFEAFIGNFLNRGVDFKMGITTTDGRSNYSGIARGDLNALTSQAAAQDEATFLNNFKNWVKVGTNGSGTEMGLKTSQDFLNRYSASWMRQDAYLVIVHLSDEQDQSPNAVSNYVDGIKALKGNSGFLKSYSIVTTEIIPNKQWETLGTRYTDFTNAIGGTVSDIHQDFYTTLNDIGAQILNLLDSFPLSGVPLNSQIQVTVNGQAVTSGWTYDAVNRVVKFDQTAIPNAGSIVVGYYQKCVGGN